MPVPFCCVIISMLLVTTDIPDDSLHLCSPQRIDFLFSGIEARFGLDTAWCRATHAELGWYPRNLGAVSTDDIHPLQYFQSVLPDSRTLVCPVGCRYGPYDPHVRLLIFIVRYVSRYLGCRFPFLRCFILQQLKRENDIKPESVCAPQLCKFLPLEKKMKTERESEHISPPTYSKPSVVHLIESLREPLIKHGARHKLIFFKEKWLKKVLFQFIRWHSFGLVRVMHGRILPILHPSNLETSRSRL